MKTTKTVTIRLNADLLERIDAVADNRSKFFCEAAIEKLNPVKLDAELTDQEKRNVIKGAKNLSDMMQDLIFQEAGRRKNFLNKMDDESFARLVASRLPKEAQDNSDLENEVLSLRECLSMLPEIEDLTLELNRVKGKLFKAEHERDLNLKLLKLRGDIDLPEIMETLYRFAVEYAVDRIARNNLPGFGDGGGLSDKAYADIASDVKRDLEAVKLYREGLKRDYNRKA